MGSLQKQIELIRRTRIGIGVATGVIALAFIFCVYLPQTKKRAQLQVAIREQVQSLNASQSKAVNLPTVAREVEILRQKLEKFDKRLPRQEELGQFIKDVTTITQQQSLQKMTYQRGAPRKTDLFTELPLSMNFEGDFVSVVSFLNQTEDMQRLTRVRSLMLKTKEDRPGWVDVNLSMNIYFAE